jgi:hypothetical protein
MGRPRVYADNAARQRAYRWRRQRRATSPRALRFERITAALACELNARWHSVLPSLPRMHCQLAYGAFLNGAPVAVAIFGRPVSRMLAERGGMLELRRFAICPHAPANTGSRMLAWLRRDVRRERPDIVRLVSYQDTEHHSGAIYKAAGWRPAAMKKSPVNWNGDAQNAPATRLRNAPILTAPKVRWGVDLD